MNTYASLPLAAALRAATPCSTELCAQQSSRTSKQAPVHSRIEATEHGYTLAQEVWVQAPIQKVWDAFVTAEGYTAWAVPVAKIELKPGGTIASHYDPNAKPSDPDANIVKILNFVPLRVLTLQARASKQWPEVMRKDAANLMNVILFEDLGDEGTRIYSYGLGYSKSPKYERMLKFFNAANQALYKNLIAYLEKGKRARFEK
ncbi:MAG: SRPBCC domain-containing protein [Planctomycetota bacterium]